MLRWFVGGVLVVATEVRKVVVEALRIEAGDLVVLAAVVCYDLAAAFSKCF